MMKRIITSRRMETPPKRPSIFSRFKSALVRRLTSQSKEEYDPSRPQQPLPAGVRRISASQFFPLNIKSASDWEHFFDFQRHDRAPHSTLNSDVEYRHCAFLHSMVFERVIGAGAYGIVAQMGFTGTAPDRVNAVAVKFQQVNQEESAELTAKTELLVLGFLMSLLDYAKPDDPDIIGTPAPFVKLFAFGACRLDLPYALAASTVNVRSSGSLPSEATMNTIQKKAIELSYDMLKRDNNLRRFFFAWSGLDASLFPPTVDDFTPYYRDWHAVQMQYRPTDDANNGSHRVDATYTIETLQLLNGTVHALLYDNLYQVSSGVPAGAVSWLKDGRTFGSFMLQMLAPLIQLEEIAHVTLWDGHLDNWLYAAAAAPSSSTTTQEFAEYSLGPTDEWKFLIPLNILNGVHIKIGDPGLVHVRYTEHGYNLLSLGSPWLHDDPIYAWFRSMPYRPDFDLQKIGANILSMLIEHWEGEKWSMAVLSRMIRWDIFMFLMYITGITSNGYEQQMQQTVDRVSPDASSLIYHLKSLPRDQIGSYMLDFRETMFTVGRYLKTVQTKMSINFPPMNLSERFKISVHAMIKTYFFVPFLRADASAAMLTPRIVISEVRTRYFDQFVAAKVAPTMKPTDRVLNFTLRSAPQSIPRFAFVAHPSANYDDRLDPAPEEGALERSRHISLPLPRSTNDVAKIPVFTPATTLEGAIAAQLYASSFEYYLSYLLQM